MPCVRHPVFAGCCFHVNAIKYRSKHNRQQKRIGENMQDRYIADEAKDKYQ